MSYQRQVEKTGDRLLVRYTGTVTSDDLPKHNVFQEMVNISDEEGIREVLLDCRELSVDLGTMDIFDLGCHVSDVSDKGVQIAALVTKEWASDTFMQDVAGNRGGNFRVFTDEAEALDWLSRT